MAVSVVIAFFVYETTLVPNESRRKGKYRKSTYYPRRFEENHQPLESWDKVEEKLIAEGNIKPSEARSRTAARTIALWSVMMFVDFLDFSTDTYHFF
jgi:hypothetical protein